MNRNLNEDVRSAKAADDKPAASTRPMSYAVVETPSGEERHQHISLWDRLMRPRGPRVEPTATKQELHED